jgi:uncharacterized protein
VKTQAGSKWEKGALFLQDQTLEQDELDAGLKSLAKTPLRLCLVTRDKLHQAEMMRFVLSPERVVTADILHKLPGKGAWVTLNKAKLEEAIKKRLFSRAFKSEALVQEAFIEKIESLMKQYVLEALSLANRSGLVIAGAFKVQNAIENDTIAAYLHASNGEMDGFRKISNLLREDLNQDANERLHFSNKSVRKKKFISRAFTSAELGKIVGKEDAVHLVVKSGAGARLFRARFKQLQKLTDDE